MALWLVRSGRSGEYEDLALKSGRSLIGFHEVPDMSSVHDKETLFEILKDAYPEHPKNAYSTLEVSYGHLLGGFKKVTS